MKLVTKQGAIIHGELVGDGEDRRIIYDKDMEFNVMLPAGRKYKTKIIDSCGWLVELQDLDHKVYGISIEAFDETT